MTFGDYVRLLRTYWKSILLVTVLGIGASLGLFFAVTPTYTATAGVLFTPVSATTSGQDLAFAAQYTQSRMVVYQGLVKSPRVLGPVVSSVGLDQTPTKLADHVTGTFDASSTLLTINVENESGPTAARIAAAAARSLISAVGAVETQPDPKSKDPNATVQKVSGQLVADPAVPTSASSPDLKLNLTAGTLLGLILALALAGIRYARAKFGPLAPLPAREPREGQAPSEPRPPKEPRRSWFRRTPTADEEETLVAVSPAQPSRPVNPPRSTKPKPQKRPGKRTRR